MAKHEIVLDSEGLEVQHNSENYTVLLGDGYLVISVDGVKAVVRSTYLTETKTLSWKVIDEYRKKLEEAAT